ncbi:MAG: ABC transporter permease [Nitrospinales bacterium]
MRVLRNFIQALRGLMTNRGNTVLMMLGMIVGIASLTVIMAIGEGARVKVMNRITAVGFGPDSFSVYAGAGRLFFRRSATPTSMTVQDADDIRAIPTVRLSIPRQRKRMKLIYKKNFTNTRMYGMTPEWPYAWRWPLSDGRYFTDDDMQRKRKVMILGSTPARKLFGSEDPIGKIARLDQIFFTVIGVLREKGMTESGYDPDDRVVIPLTTATSRVLHQTHLHSIRIMTTSPEVVDATMEEVKQILRRNHNLSPLAEDDFRFVTPAGILRWVTESEQAMNRMLTLISTVSLLVGGIVIMNIMLVSIRERIHEIGIRRCFGASRTDITLQFLFESTLVSLWGGVLGIIFGFAVSMGLKHFDVLPAMLTWEPFVPAFLLCTAIGLIFGIQPARKAAFLVPEETLR